jgi:hypothetical protein
MLGCLVALQLTAVCCLHVVKALQSVYTNVYVATFAAVHAMP